MNQQESHREHMTRREVLGLLGASARGGIAAALYPRTLAAQTFPQSAIIRTLLKDLPPQQLGNGVTLIHEHMSLAQSPWPGSPERPAWKFFDNVDVIAEEVKAVAQDGVTCIVDGGGYGLGRKVQNLRTIAEKSGIHIVGSGGLHRKNTYPPDFFKKEEDQIVEEMFRDLKAERWGIIGEIGTGPDLVMDPDERKGLRVAGKLQLRTGMAIFTHTMTGNGCVNCPLDQVDVFESVGVNPQKMIIGHLNDLQQPTAETLISLGKRGTYISFDHSGRPGDKRASEHVRMVMAVLDAGFEDRVLLSGDFINEMHLKRNGGPGFAMAIKNFVPQLRAAGVNDAVLKKITVDNPRRAIAFVPTNV
jgi:phosphotriesterase-related protein